MKRYYTIIYLFDKRPAICKYPLNTSTNIKLFKLFDNIFPKTLFKINVCSYQTESKYLLLGDLILNFSFKSDTSHINVIV